MHDFIKKFNQLLEEKGLTVAFAESITAGLLCSSVASVSGASSVLKGGIVTYDEKIKTKLLGVKEMTLQKFTAESLETTIEMAEGLKKMDLGSSLNVAITGIASIPSNSYKIKAALGDVFVAVIYNDKIYTHKFSLKGSRNEVRNAAMQCTLKFITDIIEDTIDS